MDNAVKTKNKFSDVLPAESFDYSEKITAISTDQLVLHPEAETVPRMNDSEWESLVNGIREHGILVNVIVQKPNIILDGRHRWLAAKKLGLPEIECSIVDYSEEKQLHIIFESSINRRNLSDDQRAYLAAEYQERLNRINASNRATIATNARHGNTIEVPDLIPSTRNAAAELFKVPVSRLKAVKQIYNVANGKSNMDHIPEENRELYMGTASDLLLDIKEARTKSREAHRELKAIEAKLSGKITADRTEGSTDYKYFDNFWDGLTTQQDNSFDLIWINPLSLADDWVHNYELLARECNRILRVGGSCIIYLPNNSINDVLNLFDRTHVDGEAPLQWWNLLCFGTGQGSTSQPGKWIRMNCRYLGWWTKGNRRTDDQFSRVTCDLFHSSFEQGIAQVSHRLTFPNDRILILNEYESMVNAARNPTQIFETEDPTERHILAINSKAR